MYPFSNVKHNRILTTSLDVLRPLMQRGIALPARMSWDSFVSNEQKRAVKVKEYRDFADGEHDVELSQEMKDMLRTDELILNHCENILETLSDRLRLAGIDVTVRGENGEIDEAATDEAMQWLERLTTQYNRLDGLQIDLHDAIPRDGISYMLAEWDQDKGGVTWTHLEAFDGHSGVIVVWGQDAPVPTLAIKIWHETQRTTGTDNTGARLIDRVRFVLYYPDRQEHYFAEGNKLQPYVDDNGNHIYAMTMRDGAPIGVPVIPFVYKGRRYNKHGLGRLENAIPVQKAVNRILNSTIMTSENIGFPIRYALGMDVPRTIQPGTWLKAIVPDKVAVSGGNQRDLNATERASILDAISKIRVGQLEPADITGLLDELQQYIGQMYVITGTPYPEGAGANISGEALKQLDIRLVGTANRCQTSWGNAYEDLVRVSARLEAAYGKGAVWAEGRATLAAKWVSAEVRDDTATIHNVNQTLQILPELDLRTRLEMLASIHGWDKTRIDEIEQRIETAQAQQVERELGLTVTGNGGFGAFGTGTQLDDPLNAVSPEPEPNVDAA